MVDFVESEMVGIDEVKPNDWNPNEMDEDTFAWLRKSMEDLGYVQPVIVTNDYVIIDGEHRWKALKEAGEDRIEVKKIDVSEATAKTATINLNKIKGMLDPHELSNLLADLLTEKTLDDLINEVCIPESEISLLTSLVDQMPEYDPDEEEEGDSGVDKQGTFDYTLRFTCFEDKQDFQDNVDALRGKRGYGSVEELLLDMVREAD